MAFISKDLKLFTQPIPYFLSKMALLVDFDIQVTTSKAALKKAKKGSIQKGKIVVVEESKKNTEVLNKFIKATIPQYKGLKLKQGQIEITNAKK